MGLNQITITEYRWKMTEHSNDKPNIHSLRRLFYHLRHIQFGNYVRSCSKNDGEAAGG